MPAQSMTVLTMWPACEPNRGIRTPSRNPPLATARTSKANQMIKARSGIGVLPRRMSIVVLVRGQPAQVGPVGTNDVDLQATEAVPQREGIDAGRSVTVALEHDPATVARPVSVIVEPRTADQQPELPALEFEDAEIGAPWLQGVSLPHVRVTRDNRENDCITVRRPLRAVQVARIRGKERMSFA